MRQVFHTQKACPVCLLQWEDDEVGEGHLQLFSLLALFLRVLPVWLHLVKMLCRAEENGSLLSCIKTNVSSLPFKTVMASNNWIATMPQVTIVKVKDFDKNMLWSKVLHNGMETSSNFCLCVGTHGVLKKNCFWLRGPLRALAQMPTFFSL